MPNDGRGLVGVLVKDNATTIQVITIIELQTHA